VNHVARENLVDRAAALGRGSIGDPDREVALGDLLHQGGLPSRSRAATRSLSEERRSKTSSRRSDSVCGCSPLARAARRATRRRAPLCELLSEETPVRTRRRSPVAADRCRRSPLKAGVSRSSKRTLGARPERASGLHARFRERASICLAAARDGPERRLAAKAIDRPVKSGGLRRRVLVVAADPDLLGATLVAPERGTVEQRVEAHDDLHAAGVGRVGVVDDPAR
jgi:hypothetical protein